MKHLFIVIEGTDGSGKTTLAKALAQKIGAEYYYSPPRSIRFFRKVADSGPFFTRYLYYCLGNYIASYQIRRLLKRTSVVADWYIYSTSAYHSVLLKRAIPLPGVSCLPDILVYTKSSMETINSRLNARPSRHKFENKELLERVSARYERIFQRMSNVIVVDTNGSLEASLQELLAKIDEKK